METIKQFFMDQHTQYVLSWIGLAVLLTPSVWISVTTKRFLDDFNPGNFSGARVGPRAKTVEGIQKDLNRLEKIEAGIWATGLKRITLLLFAGLVVPGVVLGALLKFQTWYLPEEAMLVGADGSLVFGQSLTIPDLLRFLADQGLRGGLSDTLEVFNESITSFESNPSNLVFSWAIVGYRLLAGLAVTTSALVIFRLIPGSGPIKAAKLVLEERRNEIT